MPGRVIAGQHSSPLSLHYPEREVCAARLPASRGALLSNTRAAQPSGRTSLMTPGLEWAGHPHASDGPYPAPHVHTFLPPLGSQVAATPPSCQRQRNFGSINPLFPCTANHMGYMCPWLQLPRLRRSHGALQTRLGFCKTHWGQEPEGLIRSKASLTICFIQHCACFEVLCLWFCPWVDHVARTVI